MLISSISQLPYQLKARLILSGISGLLVLLKLLRSSEWGNCVSYINQKHFPCNYE